MRTFLRVAATTYCVALLSAVCAAAGVSSVSTGIIASVPTAQKKPLETFKVNKGKDQKFKQCTKCNYKTKIDDTADRKTDSRKAPGTATVPDAL